MKTYFLYVSHKSPGLGLEWLGKARSIENYKSEIYSKSRDGQVSCGYLICETETESPMKSLTSACISLLGSFSSTFIIEVDYFSSVFLMKLHYCFI